MKVSLLKKATVASLILALTAPQAKAEFNLPNFIKRYEIGFTYTKAFATFKTTEYNTAPDGKVFAYDINQKVSSGFSFGGLMGSYIPITQTGRHALLAIGVDLTYNAFTWSYDLPQFQSFKTDVNGNYVGVNYAVRHEDFFTPGITIQLGLPISADLKFGAEANMQKASKWTGTFGVGAMPQASVTANYDNAGYGFGVSPFVKAEIGRKAGIIWKLRLQYTAGPMTFYDGKTSLNMNDSNAPVNQVSFTGNGVVSASLILMPFSWNFKEDGWWNWHR